MKISRSPGFAPCLRELAAEERPGDGIAELRSSSRMEWPPITVHPASIIFDKPPARMRSSMSRSALSGKQTRASEVSGSTHGVNVAERVGGGDLAEGVGIVHDRREKIHRLDERRSGASRYTPASSA